MEKPQKPREISCAQRMVIIEDRPLVAWLPFQKTGWCHLSIL